MRKYLDISKALFEVSRAEMPQIRQLDLTKALKELQKKGIGVAYESKVIGQLHPTQEDYSRDKVQSMKEEFTEPFNVSPIVCSSDGAIIDGHHRWLAAKENFGQQSYIPSYVINLPIHEALKAYEWLSKKY